MVSGQSIANCMKSRIHSHVLSYFTLFLFTFFAGSTAAKAQSGPANGVYTIQNLASGLVMDGGGSGAGNGTDVVQDANTGGGNQQWTVTSLGSGLYEITSVANSRTLNVNGADTANGTNIIVYSYVSGATNEEWTFTSTSGGYYTLTAENIVNASVNACIEPSGGSTSSGTDIVVYTCTSTSAEQWTLGPVTPTFSPSPSTYSSSQTVTISDSTPGSTIYYTTNGTTPTTSSAVYSSPITVSASETVEAMAATASGTLQSTVATGAYAIGPPPVSSEYYIQNLASGLVMDGGSGSGNGTQVVQDTNTGGNNQKWNVTSLGSGTYEVVDVANSLSLNDNDNGTSNGTEILVWAYVDSSNETWIFTPTSGGYYTITAQVIVSDGANACIEPSGGSTSSGADILLANPCTSTSAEQWELVPVNSAATPSFSPGGSTYTSIQTVTISDSTSGATIYYTTDGTTPTTSSAVYSSAITVAATQTIEAIATAPGYLQSSMGSAAYTINLPQAATPGFSPAAGSYGSAQAVTISDSTSGATIYYTTNGTTPTTASSTYSSAITVSATETMEAIAAASGYTNSSVGSAAYTINGSAATPTFSPAAGTYNSSQTVTISDGTSGATIYYTTNGTTPTTASSTYSSAITVSATETLEAIAVKTGYTNSSAGSAAYTIGSIADPANGVYTIQNLASGLVMDGGGSGASNGTYVVQDASTSSTNQQWNVTSLGSGLYEISSVANSKVLNVNGAGSSNGTNIIDWSYVSAATNEEWIFTPTSGAYFTLTSQNIVDASVDACIEPSGGSTTSGTDIVVYTCTSTSAEQWTLVPVMATPAFSPSPGTYSSTQSVTISDTITGSTIYYTTDGTTPTTNSAAYSGPITVSTSGMLQAISTHSGYPQSAVGTGVYVIGSLPANGVYMIQNLDSSLVMDGGGSGASNGTDVVQNTSNGSTNQEWTLTSLGSGLYEVSSVSNSKVLNDNDNGTSNGTNIIDWDYVSGSANEEWILTPIYGGHYTLTTQNIVTAGANACIEPSGGSTSSGTDIVVYTCTNTTAELWSFNPAAATPTFSPAAGTYTTIQAVTISDATSGSTIYYTLNGTTPTTSSSVYSSAITVSATETLEAIATATGYPQSATGSAAYTIDLPVAAAPTFSPGTGTYTSVQTVTISDTTSGSTIYYTTNGTTPTASSAVYSSAITVSSTSTVKAIAMAYNYSQSTTGSAAYTLDLPPADTPTLSPGAGTYTSVQTVTISDGTSGSTIYYTVDGSTPSTNSATYSSPITVTTTETVSAIAWKFGDSNSSVGSAAYTINLPPAATPTLSPGAGTYTTIQTVTISDSTSGSTIYYTVDGSTPSTNSTIYSSPVTVAVTETVSAIAWKFGDSSSSVGSAAYTINLPVAATPAFSPNGGSFSTAPQTVTISDSTSGSTIYYTVNGTPPTTNSAAYSTPITVNYSQTVLAIAVKTGYTNSSVGSAAFTISGSLPNGQYTIQNLNSSLVIDGGESSGSQVVQDANSGNPTSNQVWTLTNLGSGTYSVIDLGNSLSLNDLHDDTSTGSVIGLYSNDLSTGDTAEIWYLTPLGGGYYTLESQDMVTAGNGTCIEPSGGSTASGTGIVISTCTNANAQQWSFTSVAAAPTFSPAPSLYTTAQTITLSDTTSGSTIYYTTNGTTPTTASSVYSSPFTISVSGTVQAFALASGYSQGVVAIGTYAIGSLPENGLYYIQNTSSGYVMDGGGSGTANLTQVVQDTNTSGTNQQWYVYNLGNNTFSVLSNANSKSLNDLYDDTGNGSVIGVYTNDVNTGDTGETWTLLPTTGSNYTIQSQDMLNAGGGSCIQPTSTSTGAGIVIDPCSGPDQWQFSLIALSAATPTFSVAAGTYTSPQTVTISDTSSGSTIYYTTDGTTPTSSSAVYSSPLTIACCATETLQAIAGGSSYVASPVESAVYTITLPTASTPGFSPAAGSYSSAQTVTLSDTLSGATMYYTTNGTTPTTNSAVYSGPITVSDSERVEAIAVASGYLQSNTGAAYYIIGSVSPVACSSMSLGNSVAETGDLNGFLPFQSATNMLNLWDTNIVNAAVDANNAAIQTTGDFSGLHLHVNFGGVGSGGIPYTVVDSSSTPSVPIYVDNGAQSDVVVAPFPSGDSNLPIEGDHADCYQWPNNYVGDDHAIVLDRNACWLYETYTTHRCNGLWYVTQETIFDMQNGEMRPWGWTSADASGSSIFAGLIRYDEAAAGAINHAIRYTMNQTKNDANGGYFLEPASHTAPSPYYSVPNVMGMRIRLNPTFDISGYSAINQAILTAMQQYGMIVADNGGAFYFSGTVDPRWDNSDLTLLNSIESTNFSVIDAPAAGGPTWPGYDPATEPTGSAPAISSFSASSTSVSSGTSVTFTYDVSGDSYDFIDMIGPVRLTSGSGSVTITPTATQQYTLYSTNQYGETVSTPIIVAVSGSVVAPPTFAPPSGTYSEATLDTADPNNSGSINWPMQVSMYSSTYPYATIYYTTDGTTPTYPITGTTQELTVVPQPQDGSALPRIYISSQGTFTIKALALAPGYSSPSSVSSVTYVIAP